MSCHFTRVGLRVIGYHFTGLTGSVLEQQGAVAAALHGRASAAMLDFAENCDPHLPNT